MQYGFTSSDVRSRMSVAQLAEMEELLAERRMDDAILVAGAEEPAAADAAEDEEVKAGSALETKRVTFSRCRGCDVCADMDSQFNMHESRI